MRVEQLDFYNKNIYNKVIDLLNYTFKTHSFTPDLWQWKYHNNPFGDSVGWVAYEGSELIGVRILWAWKFSYKRDAKTLFQPVDTVVHPLYQRRGIFKELTNSAIELCQARGIDFYNFPNQKSVGPDLKLGWERIIENPKWNVIFTYQNPFRNKKVYSIKEDHQNFLIVDWSEEIIKWRFKDHPSNNYFFYDTNDGWIIYTIIKKSMLDIALILIYNSKNSFCLWQFKEFLFAKKIFIILYITTDPEKNLLFRNESILNLRSNLNFVYKKHSTLPVEKIKLELGNTDCY